MTHLSPTAVADMISRELGVHIRYVDSLPDDVTGFLDKEEPPTFIAVKRSCPPSEQVFTMLHELGHLCLHRRPRPPHWTRTFLTHVWDNHAMAVTTRALRRYVNRNFGPEFEADAFATLFLMYFRCQDDLREYMERHPEKNWRVLFFATLLFGLYIKRRIGAIFHRH
jgi:hypothetical protein